MLQNDNLIKTRRDVEKYALSIIKPLLESINPIWDPKNPPKGKPHWMNHFFTYLEGIARPTWVLPFILNNTKKEIKIAFKNSKIDILDWYKIALVSGTNPKLKSYWGEYSKYGQICTEIAPLAIMLALSKKKFWDDFTSKEKKQIAQWLLKISSLFPIKTHRNNHYWFPIFINIALKKLGLQYHGDIINNNLKLLDQFYMGDGWFYDGTIGRYDYYIPWSHHFYAMLWMILEDQDTKGYTERSQIYKKRTNEFLKYYIYFFDTNGLYIPFGRSLAYRFAATGLIPLAYYNGCDINPGLAKRINLQNLNIFKNNGAPPNQVVKPGFTYDAEQVVERYISYSSSYWSVKGFSSLLMNSHHEFWKAKEISMPVETGNFSYKMKTPKVNLLIEGNSKTGITLYNNSAYVEIGGFNSTNEMYSKFAYNTRAGFGFSTKDIIASDNMISLRTEYKFKTTQLASHRGVFKDLGEKNGVFYSEHLPFSNDLKTKIKTALIPIGDGVHIRIHKVRLSQKYYVSEGGFSLGRRTDDQQILKGGKWISLVTEAGHSFLYSYTPTDLMFETRKILPNYHILYPLASYPMYITKEKLDKGNYTFVTLFFFEDKTKVTKRSINNKIIKFPKIKFINSNHIIIDAKNRSYRINL